MDRSGVVMTLPFNCLSKTLCALNARPILVSAFVPDPNNPEALFLHVSALLTNMVHSGNPLYLMRTRAGAISLKASAGNSQALSSTLFQSFPASVQLTVQRDIAELERKNPKQGTDPPDTVDEQLYFRFITRMPFASFCTAVYISLYTKYVSPQQKQDKFAAIKFDSSAIPKFQQDLETFLRRYPEYYGHPNQSPTDHLLAAIFSRLPPYILEEYNRLHSNVRYKTFRKFWDALEPILYRMIERPSVSAPTAARAFPAVAVSPSAPVAQTPVSPIFPPSAASVSYPAAVSYPPYPASYQAYPVFPTTAPSALRNSPPHFAFPTLTDAAIQSLRGPVEFNGSHINPAENIPLHSPMGISSNDRFAQDIHCQFVNFCDQSQFCAPVDTAHADHIFSIVQHQAQQFKSQIPPPHTQTLAQVIDKMVQNKLHSLQYYMHKCCWHCGDAGHRWAECPQPYISRHTTGYAPPRRF